MKKERFLIGGLGVSLALFLSIGTHAQNKIKVVKAKPEPAAQPAPVPDKTESSEPDKVLYERAMLDLKKHHFVEERLSLQTLINTYPDSEYLAKAKLAVADSYYFEAGDSNYTEAIAEYKSFIVFFPFLDEAAYAQMQIAMAHYRMMEKADRDNSEGLSAEAEFQTFLLKYPQHKLAPEAQQRLRDVQEVLADGAFRVARFYYLRPDYRASAARLVDLTQRYPLYSQGDEALWMLGSIYDVAKKNSKNEDDKNHWADLAAKCYDQIVVNYPLSDRAESAKQQLKEMGMTVPDADPAAAERMRKQMEYEKTHHQHGFVKGPMAMVKGTPDFSYAARSGEPNLTPPEAVISATDILNPGASGPRFNLAVNGDASAGGAEAPAGGAVVPGTGVGANAESDEDAGGHQVVATPTTASTSTDADTSTDDRHTGSVNAPTTGSTPIASAVSDTTDAASASQADAPAAGGSTQTGESTTGAGSNPPATTAPPVAKNESSSKKKKGLSKLNPF